MDHRPLFAQTQTGSNGKHDCNRLDQKGPFPEVTPNYETTATKKVIENYARKLGYQLREKFAAAFTASVPQNGFNFRNARAAGCEKRKIVIYFLWQLI